MLSLAGTATTDAGGSGVISHFISRSFGGAGGSITASKHGDASKTVTSWSNSQGGALGVNGIQTPNSADNSYYISPIWVCEPSGAVVRGRMRGFWHVCHAAAGFSDGQVFTGANDVVGKDFQIVKASGSGGFYCLETSNTLDTN